MGVSGCSVFGAGLVRGTGPGVVLVEFLGSHNWGWVDRRKLVPFVVGGKVSLHPPGPAPSNCLARLYQ